MRTQLMDCGLVWNKNFGYAIIFCSFFLERLPIILSHIGLVS